MIKNIYWYDCPSILNTSIRYRQKYNIKELNKKKKYDNDSHILFFGFYKKREVKILEKYKNCNIYMIFGGSDTWEARSVYNLNYLKNKNYKLKKNVKYFSISNFINNDLFKYNINYIPIYFSCLDTDQNRIFFHKKEYVKSLIYVYDNNNGDVYNNELINKIIAHFGENLFIRSSKIKVDYSEMPKLLSKCFLGLRLTKHDGNANIVQELGFMGIKCIHNSFFYNSIPFIENEQTIIEQIKFEINNKNNNNYELLSKIFYENSKLSNFNINDININQNRNIDIILWTINDSEHDFCLCLKSLLFQHLVKTNVIVVSYENDCSSLYINKYYNKYHNLKYITVKKSIFSMTRNELIMEGLKYLKNDFFCIVSIKDIFYTNKINIELKILENNLDKNMCISNYHYIENNILKLFEVEVKLENLSLCNLMRKSLYNKYIEQNNIFKYNLFCSIIHSDKNNIIKNNNSLYIKLQ
jgi:hypothetical protein